MSGVVKYKPAPERVHSCVAILPYQPDVVRMIDRIDALTAWGRPSNFWPSRSVLRVKFIGGTKKQQAEARLRFEAVDALVNLSFQFVSRGSSEIRVGFDLNKGHWSYLGKGALQIPDSQTTMNLALTAGVFGDGREEWDRVAIHEILHAIGFEHEHQHPQHTIVWNREAVYAYYQRTQGWSRSMIDFQVLNRPAVGNDFAGTPFDSTSIMEYPIPKGLANIAVGWNSKLSSYDLHLLRQVYPSAATVVA